jgi:hypothetical protein
MKVTNYSGSCRILFEQKDKYAGKEVRIEGENSSDGFFISRKSLQWLISNSENNSVKVKEMDDSEKEKVITYLVDEGKKQGFVFGLFSQKQ